VLMLLVTAVRCSSLSDRIEFRGGHAQTRCRHDPRSPRSPGTSAWEAEHGLGSAWGNEIDRPAALVFDPP
jgi:hypothetical protein